MTQTNEVICKNCGQSTIPFQNSGNCEFCGENALHKTKYTSNLDLAKAIIQRYPQILAEKVWEGNPEQLELDSEKGISVIGEIPLAWNHLEIYAKGGVKSE